MITATKQAAQVAAVAAVRRNMLPPVRGGVSEVQRVASRHMSAIASSAAQAHPKDWSDEAVAQTFGRMAQDWAPAVRVVDVREKLDLAERCLELGYWHQGWEIFGSVLRDKEALRSPRVSERIPLVVAKFEERPSGEVLGLMQTSAKLLMSDNRQDPGVNHGGDAT